MSSTVLYLIGLIMFVGNNLSQCFKMKVVPGIPTITRYDPNYVEEVRATTRRNGRRSEYVFNLELTIKHYWTNDNVSMHIFCYEYLHNEYKPSFVQLHYKICDLILKDFFVGSVLRNAGLSDCPIPPGKIKLLNMTFNAVFPSVWPFEKGKCELIGNREPGAKEIGRGDLVLTFKMIKK